MAHNLLKKQKKITHTIQSASVESEMSHHNKTPEGPTPVTTIMIEWLSFRAIKETLNVTGLITKHAPRCMTYNWALKEYQFEEN